MKPIKYKSLLLASTLALSLTGCANLAGADHNSPASQALSDASITGGIKLSYANSSEVNPLNVDVTTHNHHVDLAGTVESLDEFYEAIRIASQTKGVVAVNSKNLLLKKSILLSPEDTAKIAKINGRIAKFNALHNNKLDPDAFKINLSNNKVTVVGNMSKRNRDNLIALIRLTLPASTIIDHVSVYS